MKCLFITAVGSRIGYLAEVIQSLLIARNIEYYKIFGGVENSPAGGERIRALITEATFCIADLSRNDPNVSYIVGYATALFKPVIAIRARESEFPLQDLSGVNVLEYPRDHHIEFIQFTRGLDISVKAILDYEAKQTVRAGLCGTDVGKQVSLLGGASESAKGAGEQPRPFGSKSRQIGVSAFAPSSIHRGKSFILDIWAYPSHQYREVCDRARRLGRPKEKGTKQGLQFANNSYVEIRVNIPTLSLEMATDGFLWEGQPANACFTVYVPPEADDALHLGQADIFCNGVKIGVLRFEIRETNAGKNERRTKAKSSFRSFKTAFASYATSERNDVLARLHGIKKILPNLEVFMDAFDLHSGDRWAAKLAAHVVMKDVFYLFWSRAAAESVWVDREWRLALAKRGLEYIDPIPLEGSELAPPPVELESLHFNDVYLEFIDLERLRKRERDGELTIGER